MITSNFLELINTETGQTIGQTSSQNHAFEHRAALKSTNATPSGAASRGNRPSVVHSRDPRRRHVAGPAASPGQGETESSDVSQDYNTRYEQVYLMNLSRSIPTK